MQPTPMRAATILLADAPYGDPKLHSACFSNPHSPNDRMSVAVRYSCMREDGQAGTRAYVGKWSSLEGAHGEGKLVIG
eukprot:366148-Chlamydomonas_euryale.AAC.3